MISSSIRKGYVALTHKLYLNEKQNELKATTSSFVSLQNIIYLFTKCQTSFQNMVDMENM